MGLPVVAPALPGNVELLGEGDRGSDRPARRRRALRRRARRAGAATRARPRGDRRRVPRARARGAVGPRDGRGARRALRPAARGPRRRRRAARRAGAGAARPAAGPPATAARPLVSVVIPCFNHGRYLRRLPRPRARADVAGARDHRGRRRVDRGRDARRARRARARGRRDGHPPGAQRRARARRATRGSTRARGPLRAAGRRRQPAAARRRRAPRRAAHASAGEQVGFIYPNLQYFGTRRDYFEAPPLQPLLPAVRQLLRHLLAGGPLRLRRRPALRRGHRARPRGLGLRAAARRARHPRRAGARAGRCATASRASPARTRVEHAAAAVPRRDPPPPSAPVRRAADVGPVRARRGARRLDQGALGARA